MDAGVSVALEFPPPVCEVVVGVGHIDEALDEVGALDEAEEHLEKHRKIRSGWRWRIWVMEEVEEKEKEEDEEKEKEEEEDEEKEEEEKAE